MRPLIPLYTLYLQHICFIRYGLIKEAIKPNDSLVDSVCNLFIPYAEDITLRNLLTVQQEAAGNNISSRQNRECRHARATTKLARTRISYFNRQKASRIMRQSQKRVSQMADPNVTKQIRTPPSLQELADHKNNVALPLEHEINNAFMTITLADNFTGYSR